MHALIFTLREEYGVIQVIFVFDLPYKDILFDKFQKYLKLHFDRRSVW